MVIYYLNYNLILEVCRISPTSLQYYNIMLYYSQVKDKTALSETRTLTTAIVAENMRRRKVMDWLLILFLLIFLAMCPLVSYAAIRRTLVPWNGQVMLILEDDSLVPLHLMTNKTIIDKPVKGAFLPGARVDMMPYVEFACHGDTSSSTIRYFALEQTWDGVVMNLSEPLPIATTRVIVRSPYRWSLQAKKTVPWNRIPTYEASCIFSHHNLFERPWL